MDDFPPIIGICIAAIILLIPFLFFVYCAVYTFSKTVREAAKRHKWLEFTWAMLTLLCLIALATPGDGHGVAARRAWTNNEIDQIHTAILSYETEYGQPPPATDNAGIMKELAGDNPRKIEFISLMPQHFNEKGEVVDIWGTPLRLSVADPEHPVIQSAGPDKQWNTPDDMNWEKEP